MERKELLKIYNNIFYSDLSHIEFLIANKALSFEYVDFICRQLNFVAHECENNQKMFRYWENFVEVKKLSKLKKQLSECESEEEKKRLQTEIDALTKELKPKFDVSNEESVIWSNKTLNKFLVLREELKAIEQIKNSLVPVETKSDIDKALIPLQDNKKINPAQALVWAKQLINCYFDKLGLAYKPELKVEQETNSILYNLKGEPKPFTISEESFKNLTNKTSKRNFAKTIIYNCASAYTQIALTSAKTLKGKHSYAALIGIGNIDANLKDIDVKDNTEEFINCEVTNFLKLGKANIRIVPTAKFESLMLANFIGTQAINEFKKELSKK